MKRAKGEVVVVNCIPDITFLKVKDRVYLV